MGDFLYRKYEFQWEVLDTLMGGRSLVDQHAGLRGFPMENADEADRFIKAYGFNLDDPIESAELLGNFHEALDFIRKHFLQPENPEGLNVEIPRKIIELNDVRHLVLMASMAYPGQMQDTEGLLLRNWACSLLKVMHAIAHLDKELQSLYFADIQQQILDRFYKLVQRDENDQLYLGESHEDPLRVNLVSFQSKPRKSRESLLLKLLHKPENVTENIFDQVGVRFITENKLDALRVVKTLKDSMIVMPAHVKASRSRNTLFDLPAVQKKIDELLEQAEHQGLSESEFQREVEQTMNQPSPEQEASEPVNPHSSTQYRAIQFTSRQLIKLRNPLYEQLKEVKSLVKEKTQPSDELSQSVDKIDLKYLHPEVRFFYPYEVQIVDRFSNEENEKGESAHSEYKKSQVRTAMKRVMGSLMDDTG